MHYPRKYPQDLIDTAVNRVARARAHQHHGAVTAVARELGLNRQLVQSWVTNASVAVTHPPGTRPPSSDIREDLAVLLPAELLHCRACQRPMIVDIACPGTLAYRCLQGCSRRPLPVRLVADTVGRAVLRFASHIVPMPNGSIPPEVAAAHAGRVLTRVTAGNTPTDLLFTWRSARIIGDGSQPVAEALSRARELARTDLFRARETLRRSLATIDPTTAAANLVYADAALLLAELVVRLGAPAAAIRWADYARHSFAHLHGPTAPQTLTAVHICATAHRHVGNHQRAYQLYRHLSDQLTVTAGPHAHHTLAAQANLAVVLHALGHCAHARTLLSDTITAHRREHPDHPATEHMARHLSAMRQECLDKRHGHPQLGPVAATGPPPGGAIPTPAARYQGPARG